MKRTNKKPELASQIRRHSKKKETSKPYAGNTETMISTGSTLLDLAISGGRKRGGGLPSKILVEIFGPPGSGKTVLLCEIAGAIQRIGGDIMFNDPEARLNKQFASMFDLNTKKIIINQPDTVTEIIDGIKVWKPKTKAKVHGIATDSLAALSTKLEMDDPKGDKMGMRRAKEFSEGLRKICRIINQKNYLMVCSNQIRQNAGAGKFEEQITTPGGKALAFYASVRLRVFSPIKVKKKIKIKGKEVTRVTGVKAKIEVYKNSVDAPYRTADIYIQFDYGIDDIRANLQYLKDFNKTTTYCLYKKSLGDSMEKAISTIERLNLEKELKEAVIDLWEEIEEMFKVKRIKKRR